MNLSILLLLAQLVVGAEVDLPITIPPDVFVTVITADAKKTGKETSPAPIAVESQKDDDYISVRLGSLAQEWLTNGTISEFGIERSLDNGITWTHWVSGVCPCGLDKNGNPPSVGVRDYIKGSFLVRPFVMRDKLSTVLVEMKVPAVK